MGQSGFHSFKAGISGPKIRTGTDLSGKIKPGHFSVRTFLVKGVSKINQKPSWLGTDQEMAELKEKNAKEEVKAPLTLHTEPLHYSANMGVEDVLKHIYKGTVMAIYTCNVI